MDVLNSRSLTRPQTNGLSRRKRASQLDRLLAPGATAPGSHSCPPPLIIREMWRCATQCVRRWRILRSREMHSSSRSVERRSGSHWLLLGFASRPRRKGAAAAAAADDDDDESCRVYSLPYHVVDAWIVRTRSKCACESVCVCPNSLFSGDNSCELEWRPEQ